MTTSGRLMLPGSPGSSSGGIPRSRTTSKGLNRLPIRVPSALANSTVSRGAGGYDFVKDRADTHVPFWTPVSLPTVLAIARGRPDLADPKLEADALTLGPIVDRDGPERIIERRGGLFRLHLLDEDEDGMPCVVLPLDRLFMIRASTALRLWRDLTGRSPGHAPTALPTARRDRLVLALRALDGRIDKASYRDIAKALFGTGRLPERGWKTHDLRDRTIRLARLGRAMMQGGYRRLLLYPFRGRT